MSEKRRSPCMKVSLVCIFMLFFQLAQSQYDFSELDKKNGGCQAGIGWSCCGHDL